MGTITILDYTTKVPISMIGKMAGICWGAPTDDDEKNQKRAWDCINSGHGRTTEFPDVYMIIDGYSARVMRELYTHIGGAPTRLQASTRYIDYADKGIPYIVPPKVANDVKALQNYTWAMEDIKSIAETIEKEFDIPREDVANLFPLGMESKMVYKVNFRTLVDMSHQRMCSRAYWEFRDLFNKIKIELANYSEQWCELVEECFKPKCKVCGFCSENKPCHMMPTKDELYYSIQLCLNKTEPELKKEDIININRFLETLK